MFISLGCTWYSSKWWTALCIWIEVVRWYGAHYVLVQSPKLYFLDFVIGDYSIWWFPPYFLSLYSNWNCVCWWGGSFLFFIEQIWEEGWSLEGYECKLNEKYFIWNMLYEIFYISFACWHIFMFVSYFIFYILYYIFI